MTVEITYKNKISTNNPYNLVVFVDEKMNVSSLKKHISVSDYAFISDLIKTKNLKKKIISFDISSKKKIILVSIKKYHSNSDLEKLGASFYDQFKDYKLGNFIINSETLSSQKKKCYRLFCTWLKIKILCV